MKNSNNLDNVGIHGQLTIKTFKNGVLVREAGPFKNKVVTSSGYGRNLILRALAGDATYPVEIDSASVGDNNTAPADGNTALGNSLVALIPITNKSVANNVLTVDVFANTTVLPNDTYEEFGLFCNARMLSRVIISPPYTKATGEDTLFVYTLTMTG
jgi:hypothetical protein